MEIMSIWINLMSAIYGWYLIHKWLKSSFFTTKFRTWQFQTSAQTQYFQIHLLAYRFVFFFFLGWTTGFSVEPAGFSFFIYLFCFWKFPLKPSVPALWLYLSDYSHSRRPTARSNFFFSMLIFTRLSIIGLYIVINSTHVCSVYVVLEEVSLAKLWTVKPCH